MNKYNRAFEKARATEEILRMALSDVNPSDHTIQITWSGQPYALCSGKWLVFVDDIDVSSMLGDDITRPMGTRIKYSTWSFEKDWEVVWTQYEDGESDPKKWADCHQWAKEICEIYEVSLEDLYKAFQQQDWRHNTCGGCI